MIVLKSVRHTQIMPALTILILGACSDTTGVRPDYRIQSGIEALGGCYDPTDPQCSQTPPSGDPAPGDSGVYLGNDFTPTVCTGAAINDSDQDDFDDFCEFQLALAFRPMLATDPADENLTRQSYWAVTWNGASVDILYMIGYYFDNGNQHASTCQGSTHMFCVGHFGDSEFIIVRANFDSATKHWKMWNATLSAHYGTDEDQWMCPFLPFTNCDYTRNKEAATFEYPSRRLHYPRVYVALNKHANYHSRGACNDGGAYDSDDCTYAQDYARVSVDRYRNVGSADYQRIPSATSTVNPTVYYGTEYFWNNQAYTRFCGWDGPSMSNRSNCSKGYEEIMHDWGFAIGVQ